MTDFKFKVGDKVKLVRGISGYIFNNGKEFINVQVGDVLTISARILSLTEEVYAFKEDIEHPRPRWFNVEINFKLHDRKGKIKVSGYRARRY